MLFLTSCDLSLYSFNKQLRDIKNCAAFIFPGRRRGEGAKGVSEPVKKLERR